MKLSDYEVDVKRQNVTSHMVKISNFPHLKNLADFEFSFQPQINEVEIKDLASLGYYSLLMKLAICHCSPVMLIYYSKLLIDGTKRKVPS